MTPTEPSDAAAIEQSLTIAGERGGDLTALVYAKLFARQPQMQALFWRDADGAIKGEMLMRVFDAILDFIGPRQFAHHLIQAEVVSHAGYDVPPEVFATFFDVVAEAVEEACGAAWTPAMAQAWARLLAELDRYLAEAS